MNLSFNMLLAPYRLDFFNYLYEKFDCKIYFEQKDFDGQLFSSEYLEKQCQYTPQYLKIRKIGHRNLAINIPSIINHNNPNVIFVPEFSLTTIQVIIYKLLSRKKFKVVSICDDSYDMIQGNGFSQLHHYARKLVMPFINEIILVDKRSVQWYQNKYKKGIWMPIIQNEKRMLPYLNSLEENAKKIKGIYKDKKILLFVGRLIDVKNLPVLLRAYKDLQDQYYLVIVGDGEKKEELEDCCKKLNINVIFTGKLEGDNLYSWYKAADIFILPSYKEAFGAVTNEALLAGCMCVISKNAGSSCLIEDGINGYTFNPYSTEELVQAIERCNSIPNTQKTSKMQVSFIERMNNLSKQLNAI